MLIYVFFCVCARCRSIFEEAARRATQERERLFSSAPPDSARRRASCYCFGGEKKSVRTKLFTSEQVAVVFFVILGERPVRPGPGLDPS